MPSRSSEHDHIISTLLELEKLRRDCLLKQDFATLETLFADDLVYTHSSGIVQDKPAYLKYVAGPVTFLAIERGDVCIQVFGDTAQMSGRMTNKLQPPKPAAPVSVESQVLQVWHRTPRGWQMTAYQATRLPLPQP